MLLSILIMLLLIGNVVALGSALYTLFKDQGKQGGTRTARLLFIRVSLAGALLLVIALGLWTGQIQAG